MNTSWTPDTYAAWWGAILSTLVFGWEFYKWWRSGAKLKVTVSSGMSVEPGGGVLGQPPYVCIRVTNIGDASTTITHLVGYNFKNALFAFAGKRSGSFVIGPSSTTPYPHVLDPGAVWTAVIPEDSFADANAKGKVIKIGVLHSMSNLAVLARLKLGPRPGES